jgi:glutathione synthase/RimK-type ligase-like ATP-grasp enzyme
MAAQRTGKGMLRQFAEILSLRRGPGKLGADDYYDFQLYDDSIAVGEKRRFIGWRAERTIDAVNEPGWHIVANDKLLFYSLMRDAGIAIPVCYAVYHPLARMFRGAVTVTSAAALADFIRDGMTYPFFSKPTAGTFGKGAALVRAYERATDSLLLHGGERRAVQEFAQGLFCPSDAGHVFQEVLATAPELVPACGSRVSSIRAMVIVDDEGVHVHRVVWKIPVGNNVTDNFHHGSSGNRLAAIDITSGRVLRVIKGVGFDLAEAPRHPDTSFDLQGMSLPHWQEALALLRAGARSLPGLRYQHWDVAFSDRGPVALEVNLYDPGGTDISQLTYRRGMLDERLTKLIAARARHRPVTSA